MNKKIWLYLCFILAFSSSSFANQQIDDNFDPDAPIRMTKEESQEVQAALDADKAKLVAVQKDNDRRKNVIIQCSQFLDDAGTPESIQKVQSCLSQNNGYFPQDYQLPVDYNNQRPQNNLPQTRPAPIIEPQTVKQQKERDTNLNNTQKEQPQEKKEQNNMQSLLQGVLR